MHFRKLIAKQTANSGRVKSNMIPAPSSISSAVRRMAGNAGIYFAGNILRQLVGFLMLPVYTRFLTPADYGVIGLIMFAITLVEPLFGARLGLAIPKYYADMVARDKKAMVVSTALLITGSVSTLSMVALILFRHSVSVGLFDTPDYSLVVGLFAVLIVTQAMEYNALVYIRLQQRPWLYVSVNLAKLIAQLSLNIWLVVFKEYGVLGIAISAMSSSTIFALILIVYTFYHVGLGFDRKMALVMFKFCWPLWLAGLAGLYIGSSNRFYMRFFSSLDDIGLYELAVKFSTILTMLVWEPFQQYWQIERFQCYKLDKGKLIFQNVFMVISTILLVVGLGVTIFSVPVIKIMASQEFHSASNAIPFLVAGAVFSSLSMYFNFSFFVTDNTMWISKINYIIAVLITLFYFIFIPLWGYVGSALAVCCAQIVQFLIMYFVSRRFYDMEILLNNFTFIFMVSCVAGVVGFWDEKFSFLADLFLRASVYLLALIFMLYPVLKNDASRAMIFEVLSRITRRKYFGFSKM